MGLAQTEIPVNVYKNLYKIKKTQKGSQGIISLYRYIIGTVKLP